MLRAFIWLAAQPTRYEGLMISSSASSRQSQRLLQVGVALFLFTSFEGFVIPHFAAPRLGLSVHTLSAFSGAFLITFGLLWPRLRLGDTASAVAFWFAIYSNLATVSACLLAAPLVSRQLDHTAGCRGLRAAAASRKR